MATRAPLTEAEKQYVYRRKMEGATLRQMAEALGCSCETARKWWRHRRDGTEPHPRGRPAAGILSTYPDQVRETAVTVKRTHPHWGPANVKLELKRQLALRDDELPSDSRLSVLFKAKCPEAVQPRQRRQYPEKPPSAASRPHQRWQVDGKEAVPLGDDDVATILNVRDPAGALMIASRAFDTTTEKGWRKLTLREVQDTLRLAFSAWGLPLEIQTDHEVVYVGSPEGRFPSLFTLWLVGLRVTPIVSRRRRPTDQPHVERNHRTLGDMAWKDEHCATLEQLQATLDDRRQRYNEELPVHAAHCQGRPPLEVHPWARHSGRPFHPALEWTMFDLPRVDAFLTSQVWTRKVSSVGHVSLAGHLYYVGRAHLEETVSVRFIPQTRSFRFQAGDGTLVADLAAVNLDKVDFVGYMPIEEALPVLFQLPLPLEGV
jgi:transposase-like protein